MCHGCQRCCSQEDFSYELNYKEFHVHHDQKRMLILVGQLDNKGHQVAFGDQKWKVKNGNLVVAKGINTVHYI